MNRTFSSYLGFYQSKRPKKCPLGGCLGGVFFKKNKTVFLLCFASKHVSLDKNQCLEALPRSQKNVMSVSPSKTGPRQDNMTFRHTRQKPMFGSDFVSKTVHPKGGPTGHILRPYLAPKMSQRVPSWLGDHLPTYMANKKVPKRPQKVPKESNTDPNCIDPTCHRGP